MKNTIKITALLLIAVMSLVFLVSCETDSETQALWENATYSSDTTIGEGAKTVYVDIVCGEKSITITLKTDKDTLGDALFEHGIINDASFFDTCNAIHADYAKDGAFWMFKKNGTAMNYGVNDQTVSNGERYTLEYTKS